jgi:N-dimethyltransferase
MEYGTAHADLYDLVFESRGKDFGAEARGLADLILARRPGAASVLDVACGTGAHLQTLAEIFPHVEGLEYAPAMREKAAARLPRVAVHPGDMRSFDLGRRFDAVTCMGNALGELRSPAELKDAVRAMAGHLHEGGVLIAEPWYFPDNFLDGYVGGHLHRDEGRAITRMTHSTRQGDTSRLEVRFLVADRKGFSEFSEVLYSSLFTREQYENAFQAAGCTVEFTDGFALADGRRNSPGLFVGVRR